MIYETQLDMVAVIVLVQYMLIVIVMILDKGLRYDSDGVVQYQCHDDAGAESYHD